MSDTAQQCRDRREELKGLEIQQNILERQAWEFDAEYDRAVSAHASAKEELAKAEYHLQRCRKIREKERTNLRNKKEYIVTLRDEIDDYEKCLRQRAPGNCGCNGILELKQKLRNKMDSKQSAQWDLQEIESKIREAESNGAEAVRSVEAARRGVENTRNAAERAQRKAVELQKKINTVGNRIYRKRSEVERVCNPW